MHAGRALPVLVLVDGASARGHAVGFGSPEGHKGPWEPELPRNWLRKTSTHPARPLCSRTVSCQCMFETSCAAARIHHRAVDGGQEAWGAQGWLETDVKSKG